jgi:rhodanese-related sulfurtransferase
MGFEDGVHGVTVPDSATAWQALCGRNVYNGSNNAASASGACHSQVDVMTEATVQSISPEQAWKTIEEDPRAVLIDVRSNMEYLFVGHPKGAIHVSWIDEPDWVINPHFATDVRKVLLGGVSCVDEAGCAPVLLICRSGNAQVRLR